MTINDLITEPVPETPKTGRMILGIVLLVPILCGCGYQENYSLGRQVSDFCSNLQGTFYSYMPNFCSEPKPKGSP